MLGHKDLFCLTFLFIMCLIMSVLCHVYNVCNNETLTLMLKVTTVTIILVFLIRCHFKLLVPFCTSLNNRTKTYWVLTLVDISEKYVQKSANSFSHNKTEYLFLIIPMFLRVLYTCCFQCALHVCECATCVCRAAQAHSIVWAQLSFVTLDAYC